VQARDIVVQLINRIPQLTDDFTDNIDVVSVVRVGTTLTVTTNTPHSLAVNANVSLQGAQTPLSLVSLTRSGTVGTMVTVDNHDLTEDVQQAVTFEGAVEPEFTGAFELLSVPNRKTATFVMTDSGPVTATGTPIVTDASSQLQTLSKLYKVTSVVSTTVFTVEEPDTSIPDPVGTIQARSNTRISMGVSVEGVIASYTAQETSDLWMYCVLGPALASKDRNLANDATSDLIPGSNHWRQQIVNTFAIYVFLPSGNEIIAAQARDHASRLLGTICQSILGQRLPTNLAEAERGAVNFIGDDFFEYNEAFYVHEYTFSMVSELIFDDTVGPMLDVAFRDIGIDLFPVVELETQDVASIDSTIDLDDEPLP